MKIKQIKAIRAMNTQETPQIYKEILIQKERYEFYQSVFSVISNVIMLCLIVIFFGNKIIEMAPKEMFTLYIKTSFWWYIAIALIGLRMYSGFLRYRRYQKVKSMT